MRGLAAGRPLIVFDHGWYSELPDEAVVKVPVLDEAGLTAAMLALAHNKEKRMEMGNAAKRYVEVHHRPEQVAAAYVQFIEQILKGIGEKLQ